MKRRAGHWVGAGLLAALLVCPGAQAASVKLRPQGEALTRAVQAALAQLSTRDLPITLDPSDGPTLTLGGVGVSAAPFNPDVAVRVVTVGGQRRIEFNPQGPLPLAEAVRAALQAEFRLSDWTPAAAGARFGGADLNSDGAVGLADLAIIIENFGKQGSGLLGDLNRDGQVDATDLRLFTNLYKLP